MGRAARPKPQHLASKLLQIRLALGWSQELMAERLSAVKGAGELLHASISGYEIGSREPPLGVLLQYARLANVYVEALIDDEVKLPAELPAVEKSEGVRLASRVINRGRKLTRS